MERRVQFSAFTPAPPLKNGIRLKRSLDLGHASWKPSGLLLPSHVKSILWVWSRSPLALLRPHSYF